MTKWQQIMIVLGLSIASFFIALLFFDRWLEDYAYQFFGSKYITIVTLATVLFISYFLTSFAWQLIRKRLSLKWLNVFFTLYLMILVYVLLFKTMGIRGIELNPLSFINDFIYGDERTVILNVVMFIPLGWLFKLNKRNVIGVLIFICLIEVTQFIFALGFFDLGDVAMNYLGYLLGGSMLEIPQVKKYFQEIIY